VDVLARDGWVVDDRVDRRASPDALAGRSQDAVAGQALGHQIDGHGREVVDDAADDLSLVHVDVERNRFAGLLVHDPAEAKWDASLSHDEAALDLRSLP